MKRECKKRSKEEIKRKMRGWKKKGERVLERKILEK